jgi:hypothetical protein
MTTDHTPQAAPAFADDFREIAHSGGKITFTVEADAQGHSRYQVGFTGSGPGPVRVFAMWALPQGIALCSLSILGMGVLGAARSLSALHSDFHRL